MGGGVNFTSDGGGMCSKIYVPTITEFLNGGDRIKQLELENATLRFEVEQLQIEVQRLKDEIAAKELAELQDRIKKRKVKSQIIKFRLEGLSYKEVAEKTGYSYHYVLKECAKRGLTNEAIRNT